MTSLVGRALRGPPELAEQDGLLGAIKNLELFPVKRTVERFENLLVLVVLFNQSLCLSYSISVFSKPFCGCLSGLWNGCFCFCILRVEPEGADHCSSADDSAGADECLLLIERG